MIDFDALLTEIAGWRDRADREGDRAMSNLTAGWSDMACHLALTEEDVRVIRAHAKERLAAYAVVAGRQT